MISKIEKNEIVKIQIKKFWIPFIFIILCIMNVSIIPNLLKNNKPEIGNKISKIKLNKYNEKEKNNNDERTNVIFHQKNVKNHHDKKEKKVKEHIQKKNERAHYIKTTVYILVLLSLILLSIIFIAKANMQSNIPISSSTDPRIEGYINLPETIENYQLIS